jgi:hypothetical protein
MSGEISFFGEFLGQEYLMHVSSDWLAKFAKQTAVALMCIIDEKITTKKYLSQVGKSNFEIIECVESQADFLYTLVIFMVNERKKPMSFNRDTMRLIVAAIRQFADWKKNSGELIDEFKIDNEFLQKFLKIK